MAGSFYHLWLAERAGERLFADGAGAVEVKAAFAAGSVGPDIGFFPGGPRPFSHRVHLERCGEFLRALNERATNEVERAFAAGWGLHVYTDMAVHPWVEATVDQMLRQGAVPINRDLWHMRLEWGVDCRLLAGENSEHLWGADVLFPLRGEGASLLGEVGRMFYGEDAAETALAEGVAATSRWLRRIPRLLWWTGHTQPAGRRPNPLLAFAFTRVGRKVVGDWLVRWPYFGDGAALARPLLPSDEVWDKVMGLGDRALDEFFRGLDERFTRLANADLYRGEVAGDGS